MPEHDLAALWEEHCRYEFDTRDVDATMATMVAAPYVNHIPTMAGGVGHDQLKRFYKYHFIGANPPDMTLTPVSRTVGADRLVDEMVVRFTHTTMIDWMLPGIPPTGRSVEIPGPGIGAGADRQVGSAGSTGGGCRDGGQSARHEPTEQHAAARRLAGQRREADLGCGRHEDHRRWRKTDYLR
jgi:hypothetical protein